MGPLKLGSTKKTKRKGSAPQSQPAKKQKVVVDAKIVPKAKSEKSRNKSSKRSTVDIVRNDDYEISDGDVEDFDQYKHFGGFLQSIDPQELAQKTQKQIKTSESKDKVVKRSIPAKSSNKSDTTYSSDSDSVSLDDLDTASEPSYDGDADVINTDQEEDSGSDENHQDNFSNAREALSRIFDDPEANYERKSSSMLRKIDTAPDRLPIILRSGRIQQVVSEPPRPLSPLDTPPQTLDLPVIAKPVESHDAPESFMQIQERLARTALEIIEDPEENIDKLNKIKVLLQDNDIALQKLAILTLSAVFRDIIPGYRIRPLSEVEKAEKTTKEVRKLRNFEQALVSHYQDFTKSLVSFTKVARKQSSGSDANPLKDISITAACSLLSTVPHFNFRTELVSILVGQVVRRRVDETFTKCRTCLETLFGEDEEGEASFEAMRLLCKKMKDRDFQIDESTIGIFLHLRLLSEMEDRGSTRKVDREKVKKKDRQFRTKKLKKFVKDQKEVERDMREAEAGVNAETRERLQGDTLKLVFTTYFRILKEGNRNILGAALEGLAKFTHLINVDFFGDLLEVLKELMQDQSAQNILSTRETLLCIVTAFTLLSEQGSTKETISLDLSKFMDSLYACLIDLTFNVDLEHSGGRQKDTDAQTTLVAPKFKVNVSTEGEMLLRALDAVFFKHRVQGSSRLAAFVKRLATASLHFPEKSAAAALEMTKRLVIRYSKLYSLFSSDESAGDGVYNGETDNPALSNPAAATVWELTLYRNHFSPKVTNAAQSLLDSLNETATTRR